MPFQTVWKVSPLLAICMLAGCVSNSDIAPQSALLNVQQLHLPQASANSWKVAPQWWCSLHDAQLESLITAALQNSPSLRQAAARVREAQSMVGDANAARGPHLDLKGSVRRERVAKNTIPPFLSSYPEAPIYDSSNTLGMSLNYDVDWWGKYRHQVNAAQARVDAARAEQDAAALMLMGSVASLYYQLQTNLALQNTLQQEVDNHQQLVALRRAQHLAGLHSSEASQQTQVQEDGTRQQLIALQSQTELLRHQLSALTGHGPDAANELRAVALPPSDALTPEGELTLDVLGKRPDITAQRELVESYSQQVKAARKEFYPSLSISAFGGLTTTNSGGASPNLLEAASSAWNITPAISLPIFHAGALRSKLSKETALFDQAVESYNQTLLNAIRQAADALTASRTSEAMLGQTSSTTLSVERLYRISCARYNAGLIGKDDLLNSQLARLQQRQAQLRAHSQLLLTRIQLIQAFGGGYQAPASRRTYQQ